MIRVAAGSDEERAAEGGNDYAPQVERVEQRAQSAG